MTRPKPKSRTSTAGALLWGGVALAFTIACATGLRVAAPTQMQAWVVYYDADRGLAELSSHGALFDRISLFAYELSPEGNPQPAPKMAETIPRFLRLAERTGFEPWVTVVNDVRFGLDSAILKDPVLVQDIIGDAGRREAHARELAQRVENDGFSGLHLDYERVANSDSADYAEFVEALKNELEHLGLGLEVVIEPTYGPAPRPNTTSVAVMGYDLFGPHSGPGPRATPEFVAGLQPRASGDIDSAAGLAIALSGFNWKPEGGVTTFDWGAAGQLAEEGDKWQRNPVDGVPFAALDDGSVIWFEDPESLVQKWDAAWKSGFRRLLLWRLGGNDERLFALLSDLRNGSVRRE